MSLAIQCAEILKNALLGLVLPADIFAGLAILTKGLIPAWAAAKRAIRETRVNLTLHILNSLTVGPLVLVLYALMANFADAASLRVISPHWWATVPSLLVGIIAVFAGDFIGYWRHRLEHTRFLWPSHAVHHSDTAMTWLALFRFHPINRLTTFIVDNSFLLLLGFPAYALVVNAVVKHYYGIFIHADLPWSYGRLDKIFVSPIMHRWHHSIDPAAYQTNFATVFSVFDRMFGTYRVPGLPITALGVKSHFGKSISAQLLYPFSLSAYRATTVDSDQDRVTQAHINQLSSDSLADRPLSHQERAVNKTYSTAVPESQG
jgi:sterol desaturase/sphingolipid hydroxylase (fatty acid hydroxylase superfamily)